MPENLPSPADSNELYIKVVEDFLARDAAKQAQDPNELLDRIREVENEVMRVVDLRSELILDPNHARVLADRHQELNVRECVLEIGESENSEEIEHLQQRIFVNGGFYQTYSEEFERQRIHKAVEDPNEEGWIIMESHGKLRAKKDLAPGPEVTGGDIQMRIPSIRSVKLIKELFIEDKKGDKVDKNGRDVWKKIMENPASVAWISDVCSLRGSPTFARQHYGEYHPPRGFATHVKEEAFEKIRQLNADRKIPIEWALSAVAEVTGILDHKKKPVVEFKPTLINQVGIEITRRNRLKNGKVYRNVLLGLQRARTMAVKRASGARGYLQTNWHVLAEQIWRPDDKKTA